MLPNAPAHTVRRLITCDCCGQEGLAELQSQTQGLTLQIRARRHGAWHELTLDMMALARFDAQAYADTDLRERTR